MPITTEEQQRFWGIFSGLDTRDGYLSGQSASEVLAKSGLSDDNLADIWDRSDIDADGNLDFEEFCIAMKLTYDLISGTISSIPTFLPDDLIPSSKAHLIAANHALDHGNEIERVEGVEYEEGLRDGFDWYFSPADRASYEGIYSTSCDRRGGVTFSALKDLYASLNVPESEVRRAWSMVNPRLQDGIGRDQTLVFLHILNQRHQGLRIPASIPTSLASTFRKSEVNYDTSKYDKSGTLKSKNKEFGKEYLSEKGISARAEVDNSASIKDESWDRVRLANKLKGMDEILNAPREKSKAVVIRNELQQLLAFKKAELERLDAGQKGNNGVEADIEIFRDQVGLLRQHLESRKSELKRLEALRASIKT